MYVIDPDTTPPVDAGNPDPADAAATAPDAPPDPAAVEASEAEALSAAMDEGIAAVTPEAPAAVEAAPPADVTPPIPGAEPTAAEKEAAAVAAKPEAEKQAEEAIKAEAASLGLKDKANERFVSMAKEIRELAPLREALKTAGIKDAAELPALARRAKDGDDLIGMVTETGCNAQDFDRVLNYMGTISKGRNGDRAAVEAAFKTVGEEYAAIAKALGKEIPGIHDPLAEHADLTAAIEAGDMTRKAALEVAQARSTAAAIASRTAVESQHAASTHAQQKAESDGIAALQAWEGPKLVDPNYAAIRPALNAKVAEIRTQFPPAQWAAATDLAYQALAAQQAAAAVAPPPQKPLPGPVRPSGPRPAMTQTSFASLEDAMDAGIAAATG
jgi:hypothetical protein